MPYKNKEDQRKYAKLHYENNKVLYKERSLKSTNKIRKGTRAYVIEYKKRHPCVDCKESNWIVLDFDHVNGDKKENVCDLVRKGYNLKTIKLEITKCVVRCSNCHRIITYKRRNGLA